MKLPAGKLLKIAFKKWYGRDPFREGAIIAYYAIFSLPGLMVVVITFAGYFFGTEAVNSQVHTQIAGAMGAETANHVQKMMSLAVESKQSVWASIIGIATILIGATAVFVQLQKSFNNIFEAKEDPSKSGILTFIKIRVFSFGLILTLGFLLLISLILSSVLVAVSSKFQSLWGESLLIIFKILNFLFSLGIISILFALLLKFLPDAKIRLRSVWIGAVLTSLLFVIGKSALGIYFGKAEPGSVYGAAGSIILILLWASYSSMIVFFGAEFTKVFLDYKSGKLK